MDQKHRPSFLHLRLRHSLTAQDDASEKLVAAFIEGRNGNGGSGMVSRTDSPVPGSQAGDSTPLASVAGMNDRVRSQARDTGPF